MATLLFRRPRADEAQQLTQIALASKRHWGYPEAWISLWRDGMRITPHTLHTREFWIGCQGQEIVAIYSIRRMDGDSYELEDFWVAPNQIGRGFGKRMFQHLRTRLVQLGAARLKIVSDPHAVPFYKRMGAVPIGTEPSLPPGRTLPVLEYKNSLPDPTRP